MNQLSQTLAYMEAKRRQKANKAVGWIFAAIIFFAGFAAGAFLF